MKDSDSRFNIFGAEEKKSVDLAFLRETPLCSNGVENLMHLSVNASFMLNSNTAMKMWLRKYLIKVGKLRPDVYTDIHAEGFKLSSVGSFLSKSDLLGYSRHPRGKG